MSPVSALDRPYFEDFADTEIAALFFFPVFRFAAGVTIRSNDAAFLFNGFDIEKVIFAENAKPNVFGTVFPVSQRASPFFAFPGDAVFDDEAFFQRTLNRAGRSPFAAHVN